MEGHKICPMAQLAQMELTFEETKHSDKWSGVEKRVGHRELEIWNRVFLNQLTNM